jgi:hypothetical protein
MNSTDSGYKLYGLFVGLTVTIMIVCDTLVYKVIDIYGFKITASGKSSSARETG